MSRRGLYFLDELDTAEERDRLENEARAIEKSPPLISDIINLALILGLNEFEPDPFLSRQVWILSVEFRKLLRAIKTYLRFLSIFRI
jgi:hypothetical protein